MKKRHLNSYLKLIIIIIVSGFIGGIIGFSAVLFDTTLADIVNLLVSFIQYNAPAIMWILAVCSIVFSLTCYVKCSKILQQYLSSNDDNEQDFLDKNYDFWGTFGISGTNILLCLILILFAFPFTILFDMPHAFFLHTLAALFVCLITCCVFQIALVKQMKKKDPVKYDDAMSFNFASKWLQTCDEGERQIIYQASYKTFQFTSKLLLFVLVIAILSHILYGNGLLAIVLIGVIFMVMLTAYSVYTLRLQKEKITE